jgi:hypothetical protein
MSGPLGRRRHQRRVLGEAYRRRDLFAGAAQRQRQQFCVRPTRLENHHQKSCSYAKR